MSRPESRGFAGPVIGGPMAGKFYKGRTGRWHVEVREAFVRSFDHRGEPKRQMIEPQSVEYIFGEPFGVGMWFPRGWTQDQVLEEIIRNYRPSVVEREAVQTY